MEVTGTGIVEIENQTTDNNTTLTVAGNGAGTPTLNLKNSTKEVRLTCETDDELYVRGPTSGERFTFDASSSTGGITWPDGTEQITAATGGGGYGDGAVASLRVDGGWGSYTNNWHTVNEIPAIMTGSGALKEGEHLTAHRGFIPIYVHKDMTVDYIGWLGRKTGGTPEIFLNVYGVDSDNLCTGSPLIEVSSTTMTSGSEPEWNSIAVSPSVALTQGYYWMGITADATNVFQGGYTYPTMAGGWHGDFTPFMSIPFGTATTVPIADNFTYAFVIDGTGQTLPDPIDLTVMEVFPISSNNMAQTLCPSFAFREE